MAVITKEQVEFLLEEGVRVRMENDRLTQENERLRALVNTQTIPNRKAYAQFQKDVEAAYDRGYDAGHTAARSLMKG